MANCQNCAYANKVGNTGRLTCVFDWLGQKILMPLGDQKGVNGGGYNFPLNFDPKWQVGTCQRFALKRDDGKAISAVAMHQLARTMFGGGLTVQ